MDRNFTFEYQGKEHRLFDIIGDEDFMFAAEVEDDVPNIILKSGIRKLRDYFGFKPVDYKVLYCDDTASWGTMLVIQARFVRPPSQEIDEEGKSNDLETFEDRIFVGDGEVNAVNFTNKDVCFPFAVALKRAESRALTAELGIPAFGEDEAEAFGKAKRSRNRGKGSFTPKSAPSATKSNSAGAPTGDYNEATDRLKDIKEIASKKGYERQDLIGILRVALKNVTGEEVKGVPQTEQFAKNPKALDEAVKIIESGEWQR